MLTANPCLAPAAVSGFMYGCQILQPYMPIFFVSFLVTLVLTPLMRHLALKHGVVDEPDFGRKIHAHPVAYLGGVATFLGWLAGVVVSLLIVLPKGSGGGSMISVQMPPGVILGAGAVVLFGLLDDVYSLPPRFKIFGQFLGGMAFFFLAIDAHGFLGVRLDMAKMFIFPLERYGWLPMLQLHHPMAFATFATMFSAIVVVFIIVAACNATNLLDGLDGLCSGVTGIMAMGYLILAVFLATQNLVAPGIASVDPTRIALSLALLGSVLGFLPFNFNPATIFMGDTGSMFLGFNCGTMIILFANDGIFRWFLGALVIFGLPMLDTFLAIIRRKINGRPVFSPDSGHFHHFLIKRGLSVRQAVLVSYALTAVFVSFALVIVIIPTGLALGIYLVLFGWLVVAAFKMGMIFQEGLPPRKKPVAPSISTAAAPPATPAGPQALTFTAEKRLN